METNREFSIPLLLLGIAVVSLFAVIVWQIINFFFDDSLITTIVVFVILLFVLNPPDEV